jgi:glucose/arabinose dehydrogenase
MISQNSTIQRLAFVLIAAVAFSCSKVVEKVVAVKHERAAEQLPSSEEFPMIRLPEGYKIEKVAEGLTYPTAITWDDQGQMYVAEAGGDFLDLDAPARILRIEEDGTTTEVMTLEDKGIYPSVVGLTWHEGAFYFTHREQDLSGAVSKVTPDGTVTKLFGGIVDSKSDHQPNDIRVGPDGRMYVCVGIGGNSGVMDQSQIPFILKAPDGHATAAKDIVLRGVNLEIPDFRTKELGDFVKTGAFVPFGTKTHPGQVIKGSNKAGGTVLVFDPDNAEATVQPYAWGFRNAVGMAWNQEGEMFVCQNGYDNVPSRPINDAHDPTYRVKEGAWYGWPDFTANFDPVTNVKYKPFESMVAPHYIDGKKLDDDNITFLIDHEASGLEEPDESLILGLHEINSSPSMPDVAPASWGEFAGHLFVPEWGDMAWFNNAIRDKPAGNKISRINPEGDGEQDVEFFIINKEPGPASKQGEIGQGIERPFCVRFGPDGAMYIADFGQHIINLNRIADGHLPFEFVPETGVIWKVTKISE